MAFPIMIFLTSQAKKPMWGFSHLFSMSIPILHFRTGEITTEYIQGPYSWAPTLTGEPWWQFGSPGISVSSEPVSSKSDYFLLPNVYSTMIKDHRSLGESWENGIYLFFFFLALYQDSSSMGLGLPFIQEVLGLPTVSSMGTYWRSMTVFIIQVRLLFTWLRTFLLIQRK